MNKKMIKRNRLNTIESYANLCVCTCVRASCDCATGCMCQCAEPEGSTLGWGTLGLNTGYGTTGNTHEVTSANMHYRGMIPNT